VNRIAVCRPFNVVSAREGRRLSGRQRVEGPAGLLQPGDLHRALAGDDAKGPGRKRPVVPESWQSAQDIHPTVLHGIPRLLGIAEEPVGVAQKSLLKAVDELFLRGAVRQASAGDKVFPDDSF